MQKDKEGVQGYLRTDEERSMPRAGTDILIEIQVPDGETIESGKSFDATIKEFFADATGKTGSLRDHYPWLDVSEHSIHHFQAEVLSPRVLPNVPISAGTKITIKVI